MKVIKVEEIQHASLNPILKNILDHYSKLGITVSFKLDDILKRLNLSEREVARITHLRVATISDLCNGTKGSINLQHLIILMIFLRISDFNEIIDINIPEELRNNFDNDKNDWLKTGLLPNNVIDLIKAINIGVFND